MRRNPHVPERTASGVALLMEAHRKQMQPRYDAMLAAGKALSQQILLRIYHMSLQEEASDEAMVSGAMPREFHKSELRFE
jgi:hypothetical protein